MAQLEIEDTQFTQEIQRRVLERADNIEAVTEETQASLTSLIRRIMERFLLTRGEVFARSVQGKKLERLPSEDLHDVAIEEFRKATFKMPDWCDFQILEGIVIDLLAEPGPEILPRLRRLADSYSLMAFLRETPDVQAAVSKMFGHGEIWLDTSILLPILAEELLEPGKRSFSHMIAAAREAAIRLNVTPGVIEELLAHIRRCQSYQSYRAGWVGRAPFLYTAYSINARHGSSFSSWIEHFVGNTRAEDDIAEYLSDEFGIEVVSLLDDVEKASPELRSAIKEEWIQVHEKRRQKGLENFDEHVAIRLAEHDTENYLGAIQRRSAPLGKSPFGYTAWWLTLDAAARTISSKVAARLTTTPPASPVLSPDFLVNYLAFGPVRRQVSKNTEAALPLILEGRFVEELPTELIEQIERIREENKDLPDRIVKRRIRDALDAARRREGDIARGGTHGVEQRFGA